MPEYHRRLPHFHPEDTHLFITWRLWGSLPAKRSFAVYPTAGHAFLAQDRAVDRPSSAPLWLKDPRIAELVAQTILIGDSERNFYQLYAWVVMPNHVHLLILPQIRVPVLLRWLQGSTVKRANKILARTGQPFWQEEFYDHYLRTPRQMSRTREYIEQNPVIAGLVSCAEEWLWSRAHGRAKPPAPP